MYYLTKQDRDWIFKIHRDHWLQMKTLVLKKLDLVDLHGEVPR